MDKRIYILVLAFGLVPNRGLARSAGYLEYCERGGGRAW